MKKLLCITAGICLSAQAIATGAVPSTHKMANTTDNTNVYMQYMAGYSTYTMQNFGAKPTGAVSFAGNIGYTFLKDMALEFGGNYTMKAKAEVGKRGLYNLHLALRIAADFTGGLSGLQAYAKGGAAYAKMTGGDKTGHITPWFGLGFAYSFTKLWGGNFGANIEWQHLGQYTGSLAMVPATNTFLAGINWQFAT